MSCTWKWAFSPGRTPLGILFQVWVLPVWRSVCRLVGESIGPWAFVVFGFFDAALYIGRCEEGSDWVYVTWLDVYIAVVVHVSWF